MKDTLYNNIEYNNIEAVLAEDQRRQAVLDGDSYEPLKGIGCWGDRVEVAGCRVPRAVVESHPDYASLGLVEQERLRISEDFEFWCARCVTIRDKWSGRIVPLVLNRPQRRLVAVLEEQRQAGLPIRAIILKARQWGGSTLVQMYMAWMQLVRHLGWNSLICSHNLMSSRNIKRMYNMLLQHYPRELLNEEQARLRFTKLEGQPNVQQLEGRECLVLTCTARNEDASRGYDISMAHLSEVAYWQESTMHSPDDVARSVCGSVIIKPESVIVLESTADGVGSYFHDEWLRAEMGRSDKVPVFVPWHEIAIYTMPVDDAAALWQEMDDYERKLWRDGCTLSQINWYHHKRREYREHSMMMAEYPTTATEAFVASGSNPFASEHLDDLEEGCRLAPVLVGDIQADGTAGLEARKNVRLVRASNGLLRVWELPQQGGPVRTRYLVVVDVGGRSSKSDYSVIAVWRIAQLSSPAAIVAQWRGHIDHDELAWKAMQLALHYNHALLVVESNTLTNEAARAGESDYILKSVYSIYSNVYQRGKGKLGFHTNVKTKREAITALIRATRCGSYIERDREAVNEMRDFEERNGRYGARDGKHDDILMTHAIGLLVMEEKQIGGGKQSPSPSMAQDVGTFVRSNP